MDGISFKDAFLSLGGHYDKPETKREAAHRKRDLAIAERKREKKQAEIQDMKRDIRKCTREMNIFRTLLTAYKPFSPPWCDCMAGYTEAIQKSSTLWEEVNKNGIS